MEGNDTIKGAITNTTEKAKELLKGPMLTDVAKVAGIALLATGAGLATQKYLEIDGKRKMNGTVKKGDIALQASKNSGNVVATAFKTLTANTPMNEKDVVLNKGPADDIIAIFEYLYINHKLSLKQIEQIAAKLGFPVPFGKPLTK